MTASTSRYMVQDVLRKADAMAIKARRRAEAKAPRAQARAEGKSLSYVAAATSRFMVLVHHPGNPDSAPSGKLIDATSPELAMTLAVQELTERTTPLGPGCYVWAIPWDTVKQWVQPAMEDEALEPLYRNARTLPGRGWPSEESFTADEDVSRD